MKNYASKLNATGKLARAFIQSKLTILIIMISVLFGWMALQFTPRTYNPEIVVPVVNISISRPGSNAETMLKQIVRPLESLMHAVPGVDHTYGMAMNDQAVVTVRFKVNESEENSLVKVYNQINSNMNKIPLGTAQPLIQSVSLYDVPLVTITLSSKDENAGQLRSLANHLLEKLRSVPGAGNSWVMGSSPAAVRVWLDPKKLLANHISVEAVHQALMQNNLGTHAGSLDNGNTNIPLRLNGLLKTPNDVGNVMIGINQAKPVLLKDVATITTAPEDRNVQSYFAFGKAEKSTQTTGVLNQAITIAIARQKGSNGVFVADDILKRLSMLEKTEIPSSITTTITRNYGADANDAVNTLVEHLCISIAAVVIILLFFLGWRESSIVIITIPLILFLVLGIGWVCGQTINRITLFALILSLGLLVDDSIVVIENIHRHLVSTKWHNFTRTIILAANEIGRPTIIATLTVILALIPMAFVGGMMGPFMGPIPFNAPLAMIISLLIAYTVVPYLSFYGLRNKARSIQNQIVQHEPHQTFLHRWYVILFTPLINSRKNRHIFYLSIVGLMGLSLLQPLWQFIRPSGSNGPISKMGVELKMLPDDNVNTFLIEIDSKKGSAIDKTKSIADEIISIISQNKYVTNTQEFLGKSAPEDFGAMVRGDQLKKGSDFAQIRVNLVDKHDRSIGSHTIIQKIYASLHPVIAEHKESHIKIYETPPGPPVRSQMEGALYGHNYLELQNFANQITQTIYPKIYGMINIDNSVTDDLYEYQILINQNDAIFSGLNESMIANEIVPYFNGVSVGGLYSSQLLEPENIILKLPKISRNNISDIENLDLINKQNELVPLKNVASIQKILQNKPIFTRDQHKVVYVTGEMLHSSPVNAVITATHLLKEIKLPNGSSLSVINLGFNEAQPNTIQKTQFSWLGEMRLTLDVFRDLGSAFVVALILIYLLLTGFYRSFSTPLIIMGAIPLTIIGVFPGHWIMHQPFTATSMIGVIALAGIVVRNSLLLIDFIISREKQGISIEKAVLEAAVVRLTPIILTALAIIFGSAVMLSDPVFGGLAISLIFGSIASTVLTLFLIPLMYLGWKRFKSA